MKLKYLSWIPAVIIMGIIFYFSSRQVDTSNESSITIANSILSVYENITNSGYQEDVRTDILGIINHVVRKGAHFCEYALLACSIAFHLLVWKRKRKWTFILPVILSAIYASTDEFHQTLVQGRGGRLADVLLDTAGAATGMLLLSLVLTISARRIMKRKKKATLLQ